MPKTNRQLRCRRNEWKCSSSDSAEGAEWLPNPERGVDDQVHVAADARRDQFVDGRVDGRIFAADAAPVKARKTA